MLHHTFDVCPCPALYPHYHKAESIVVVVDILRAGTSMVTAFAHGAKEIIPVATTQEATCYMGRGFVVAAERNAIKCPWADLGNDPREFTTERVSGRRLVFTTTNGTQAIRIAQEAGDTVIVVGSFGNLTALADYCRTSDRSVVVLASGWQNNFCLEDTLFAGALLDKLQQMGTTYTLTDSSRTALELYHLHSSHLYAYLSSCDHNQRLIQCGYADSLRRCLETDTTTLIPMLSDTGQLLIG